MLSGPGSTGNPKIVYAYYSVQSFEAGANTTLRFASRVAQNQVHGSERMRLDAVSGITSAAGRFFGLPEKRKKSEDLGLQCSTVELSIRGATTIERG